jgi:hypothetical protein
MRHTIRYHMKIICIILASMLITPIAFGQEGAVSSDIQFKLSPTAPGPNQTIRIDASSFSVVMDTARITWTVNGVVVESAIGKKSITVQTGFIGSETVVTVKAVPEKGRSAENSTTIRPGNLNLIWAANTYTPPGYSGKPLPTRGSTITIRAFPTLSSNLGRLSVSDLSFEWRLNNVLQSNHSGRGRDTFRFTINASPNIEQTVSVSVSSGNTNTSPQKKEVVIRPREPQMFFYEIEPLRGPQFDNAILNRFLLSSGREVQFLAVPYFMRSPLSSFSSFWKIDNNTLPNDGTSPNILNYRSDAGSSGRQTISYEIENPSYIFERAKGSFIINVQ